MNTQGFDVPSSRAIAEQLLTLSKDPENQPFIVEEQGCLAGLVQYTQHDDVEVVLISTRALQLLSSHPSNAETMRKFPSLVENLLSSLSRSKEDDRLRQFVFETLDNLSISYKRDEYDNELLDEENSHRFANGCDGRNDHFSSKDSADRKPKRPQGSFRTITFSAPGLRDRAVRQKLEMMVIQIEGVISVSANTEKEQLLIGTRDEGNDIIKDIVENLSTEDCSVRVVVPRRSAKHSDSVDEPSSDREEGNGLDFECPDYLEESDYDTDEEEYNAVARHGYSSLEARLEKQRKEEEERRAAKSSRLVSKVSSMLSGASSWLMGY